ncbi:MAG: ACT domain-containing protein [Methanomassiliicoccales archaeon]
MRLWDFGRLKGSKIKISEKIGQPLGLVNGSQVFSSMFRYDYNGRTSYEIVLSTFGPENYREICDATFYMLDVPGACAQIAKFLGDRNIDILNSVSLSVISNVCMMWKMLVDLSYYGSYETLLEEFSRLKQEGSPLIDKVEAMEIKPSHISDRYTKGVVPSNTSVRTRTMRKIHRTPSIIRNGEFEIPSEYLRMIEGISDGQVVMMVGDTDAWVLSITFLNPETTLAEIDFIIPDKPGAIYEVTSILAKYNINLVSVYTKVLVYYDTMTLELVGDMTKSGTDLEDLRKVLVERISALKGKYELVKIKKIEIP